MGRIGGQGRPATGMGSTIKRAKPPRVPRVFPPPTDPSAELEPGILPTKQFVSWAVGNGAFKPIGPTRKKLPAGIYNIRNDHEGWHLEATTFNSDELMDLPGLPTKFIMDQISTFWVSEKRFRQCGLLHKRGILLYGAAGCGKTSIIKMLSNDLVNRDGIVIILDTPELCTAGLQAIRQIEPDRPLLTIIEDIDIWANEDYEFRNMLMLLDGETQIDHVVHLATTNHPDVLGETLVKRPGRFDVVIELNRPVREAREVYLRALLGKQIPDADLTKLVDGTAGLGLSHLRELVSATYCLQLDMKETLERLKGNIALKLKEPKVGKETGVGFTVGFRTDKD